MPAIPALDDCDTLMLDMDGTLLDLAFDNFMWLQHIPAAFAAHHGLAPEVARAELFGHYRRLQGKLDWYCLDHWSERLGIDVVGIHREQGDRIAWLPGAQRFLEHVKQHHPRVLMVTNAHPDTLSVKAERTGITQYFDRIYTSHEFGFPKEDQAFWDALRDAEGFDPARTLFVDDTEPVLRSARRWGVGHVLHILHSDTSRQPAISAEHAAVNGVSDLLE